VRGGKRRVCSSGDAVDQAVPGGQIGNGRRRRRRRGKDLANGGSGNDSVGGNRDVIVCRAGGPTCWTVAEDATGSVLLARGGVREPLDAPCLGEGLDALVDLEDPRSPCDDVLSGTLVGTIDRAADPFLSHDGADRVFGGRGDDTLRGGAGPTSSTILSAWRRACTDAASISWRAVRGE
jgi:Ca2+-binding RTX toxin-like protein